MSTERTATIEGEASAWLIRRDSGMWTPEDEARFTEWLAASTLHKVAYLRLELAWEDAARLKALGAGVAGEAPPPPGEWHLSPFFESAGARPNPVADEAAIGGPDDDSPDAPKDFTARAPSEAHPPDGALIAGRARRPRLRVRHFALAATVLLASGITYFALNQPSDHYRTGVGRIESVPLQDGSRVTLNTDSEIRVHLTQAERQVTLEHGEAFFVVAKDPRRPFVVKVGDKRVIAVGTQFSVRRGVNDAEVVVTEGQVRVEDAGETLLTPGSIARAGDAGVLVQRKTVAEVQEQLSWRSGILMFRDQTLGEAAAEFNRYNERKIVIADPKVAALRIEGNFRATNVDAFVRLLENGFPVRAATEGRDVVLTSTELVAH